MKKNKNSSALMRISELHYLYVCATILDKAIQTIGTHLFSKEQLVPIDVHMADIMMALNAKSNELKK